MARRILMAPVALVVLLGCQTARAEMIEVPLAGVVGGYVCDPARGFQPGEIRTVSFDLGGAVVQVNGAWIRWSGSLVAGWGDCDGGSFRWVGRIVAYLDQVELTAWRAEIGVQGAPWEINFDETLAFASAGQPAWDFLGDGSGDLIVAIDAAQYFCGEMLVPPTATLDTATLILDVVVAPVPVESTTWGRVKALYRD